MQSRKPPNPFRGGGGGTSVYWGHKNSLNVRGKKKRKSSNLWKNSRRGRNASRGVKNKNQPGGGEEWKKKVPGK